MSKKSIFEPRRFEFQGSHLYYLPEKLASELRIDMPVFLVGLRGTGKTTLLHSLSWEQRTNNKVYEEQLKEKHGHAFFDRLIGIYTKLPETKIADIGTWLDNKGTSSPNLFALYYDLIIAELLCDAVGCLSASGVLTGTVDLEIATVNAIASDIWSSGCWSKYLKTFHPRTFKELSVVFKKVRSELEYFSECLKPLEEANEFFRPPKIGSLGKDVSAKLEQFCNYDFEPLAGQRKWSFRVCMDEGEHLSAWQQKVVNSIFRLAKWPLFYIVAYVELPDVTSTFLAGLTLSAADRKLIELTIQSDTEFREYVEGVVNVRLTNEAPEIVERFSVQRVFGSLQINRILDSILKESVSPVAIALQRTAAAMQKAGDEFPPYLEAFYNQSTNDGKVTHLDEVDLETIELEHWEKRRESSSGFRKKFVAAYLSLCRQLNIDVRYAFARMILQISDKCVRDFLSQVHEIFIEADCELDLFLSKNCDWKTQDKGIRKASDFKRKSFGSMLCVSGADALIDGLGQVTGYLQSAPGRSFTSPELGRFRIARKPERVSDRDENYLDDALYDAVLSGFLRFSDNAINSTEEWMVQLHASLAPHYGFSYRGAVYECEIHRKDLLRLLSVTTPDDIATESKKIAAKIGSFFDELPLLDYAERKNEQK